VPQGHPPRGENTDAGGERPRTGTSALHEQTTTIAQLPWQACHGGAEGTKHVRIPEGPKGAVRKCSAGCFSYNKLADRGTG
jgi:hypothetical protein